MYVAAQGDIDPARLEPVEDPQTLGTATQRRIVKKSGWWYREVIALNGIEEA